MSSEVIGDFRRKLFRNFLENAPGHICNIAALLQKHGSTKASLDQLVTRFLWEHLAQGPAGGITADCTRGK